MLDILIQCNILRKLIQISIDDHTHITALLRPLQHLFMASFPSAHHRREQLNLRPLRKRHDLIHHLIHRLLTDHPAALRAVGDTNPGVKKAEIIINLRYRSHRRTGIAVGRLLIDGNRRRKSLNTLHIRFFHLSKELAGVRREALHIPPLPLRINRLKRKRTLTGAAQPCQNHKFVSRNVHIQMLQIILTGTADLYKLFLRIFLHHFNLCPISAAGRPFTEASCGTSFSHISCPL